MSPALRQVVPAVALGLIGLVELNFGIQGFIRGSPPLTPILSTSYGIGFLVAAVGVQWAPARRRGATVVGIGIAFGVSLMRFPMILEIAPPPFLVAVVTLDLGLLLYLVSSSLALQGTVNRLLPRMAAAFMVAGYVLFLFLNLAMSSPVLFPVGNAVDAAAAIALLATAGGLATSKTAPPDHIPQGSTV